MRKRAREREREREAKNHCFFCLILVNPENSTSLILSDKQNIIPYQIFCFQSELVVRCHMHHKGTQIGTNKDKFITDNDNVGLRKPVKLVPHQWEGWYVVHLWSTHALGYRCTDKFAWNRFSVSV